MQIVPGGMNARTRTVTLNSYFTIGGKTPSERAR